MSQYPSGSRVCRGTTSIGHRADRGGGDRLYSIRVCIVLAYNIDSGIGDTSHVSVSCSCQLSLARRLGHLSTQRTITVCCLFILPIRT